MTTIQPVERLSYGLDDAAAAIGVSRRTMYEYINANLLQTIKIGGRRLVLRDDLNAFLAAAKVAA